MAFKPNYNQQRAERNRAKEQKKQEKLQRREEEVGDRAHVQLPDGALQDRVLRLREHRHGARLAGAPVQLVLGEEGRQGLLPHAGEARLAAPVLRVWCLGEGRVF